MVAGGPMKPPRQGILVQSLRINVSQDQVFSLLLVTESPSAPKWCKAVERALNDPASLP